MPLFRALVYILRVYALANDKNRQNTLGLKKILFVSDFRPTLSKHVRPKFILLIHKLRDELLAVVKVAKKTLRKGEGGQKSSKKQKIAM